MTINSIMTNRKEVKSHDKKTNQDKESRFKVSAKVYEQKN